MDEPLVKICGLTRTEDARAAADAGAAYLGVVVVPDTPRAVSPADARRIAGDGDGIMVLVSADRPPERLARDADEAGARILQLHGSESPDDVRRLREAGGWGIWKSVRVREGRDVEEAIERYGELVDALHLDAWHPDRLGGTGERFSWEEVRALRSRVPEGTGLVAAGGLTPENVAEAVEILDPDVVDVSSGVEQEPGVKDPRRIRAFVRAVRAKGAAPSVDSAARRPDGTSEQTVQSDHPDQDDIEP